MHDMIFTILSAFNNVHRSARTMLFGLAMTVPMMAASDAARAATPAESFIQSDNIQKGLADPEQSRGPQRERSVRELHLEGLTDIARIGPLPRSANARRAASPEQDIASFDAAFKSYAVAVYQSRLSAYTGQTLKVTGSTQNGGRRLHHRAKA